MPRSNLAGMSLRTVIELAGNCSVVAESGPDIDRQSVVIKVYLGDALVLQLPPDVADALADALADTEPVITWPSRPIKYR